MSINKLALIRYKIIDNCLRQTHRKWTLEDLIQKVSDGLYELEGIHSGVSKRTIQGDIQLMRSNKLGYNAPIIVTKRKFYTYEDLNYSISNSPLSDGDMSKMRDAVDILKHLNGFSYFEEMSDMVAWLENNLFKRENRSVSYIQLESNKLLKGLNWITPLHKAIREKTPLLIMYKSFKSRSSQEAVYFPYLLKEYRNRWFLICKPKNGKTLITLALDRIQDIAEMAKAGYVEYDGVDFERYYADTIGVTKSEKDRGHRVILRVDAYNAPYVLTKPVHASQQLLKMEEDGSILIRLDVVLNFELEREIFGFGECIRVLAPKILRDKIRRRAYKLLQQYKS
jgi:predicted DNA-binding transcriptional regulator YafY